MLRYLTSGESHGQGLITIIDGIPSNIELNIDEINEELRKRQGGYGRGGRMKIEKDKINIIGGVRGKKTIGAPISFEIKNKDFENWEKYMSPMNDIDEKGKIVENVRPGHADLVGCLKYDFDDARNVLERSSARETASRVAVGAICKQVLKNFDIEFLSHVVQIGEIKDDKIYDFDYIKENVDNSEIRCVNKDLEEKIKSKIDKCRKEGDTLGGIIEVRVKNLIPGLGSYTHFDKKIDGHLAMHLMATQAIKGVEIGLGFETATLTGSDVMDEILYNEENGITRKSNNLGGIEGGMTTGEEIIIRCAMKPIPTLYKPLDTININTLEKYKASVERSDSCAVPACSIVCENVVAFVICKFFLDKIGGDSLEDLQNNYKSYMKRLGDRGWKK
ncbi:MULTISPECIES: chorismate synthase [Terrisporobacter]|uniref:Chorismate synthase n=1 Tax=Terrisporobacter othiniensis TaxID=1577792 RepID=A0A0B3WT52_9FIRM|nr:MULTISPECIES: chorismate synthase [Terrisporobacter]KHS57720.1 chorismate synthase [Terrisporobacter othiniensis]MCC3670132.1 chorismate synthase [Terrisporobacter mayombei]